VDQGGAVGQDDDEGVERRLEVQHVEDTGLRGQPDGPVVDLEGVVGRAGRDVVVAVPSGDEHAAVGQGRRGRVPAPLAHVAEVVPMAAAGSTGDELVDGFDRGGPDIALAVAAHHDEASVGQERVAAAEDVVEVREGTLVGGVQQRPGGEVEDGGDRVERGVRVGVRVVRGTEAPEQDLVGVEQRGVHPDHPGRVRRHLPASDLLGRPALRSRLWVDDVGIAAVPEHVGPFEVAHASPQHGLLIARGISVAAAGRATVGTVAGVDGAAHLVRPDRRTPEDAPVLEVTDTAEVVADRLLVRDRVAQRAAFPPERRPLLDDGAVHLVRTGRRGPVDRPRPVVDVSPDPVWGDELPG
jgi:hypothetical protein